MKDKEENIETIYVIVHLINDTEVTHTYKLEEDNEEKVIEFLKALISSSMSIIPGSKEQLYFANPIAIYNPNQVTYIELKGSEEIEKQIKEIGFIKR